MIRLSEFTSLDRRNTIQQNKGQNKGRLINENIRFKNVLLIDERGVNHGVIETRIAQYKANDAGMDLVCIDANVIPAVCRIMDYSKYLYDTKKRAKQSRTHRQEIKEIQLRSRTESHDVDIKIKKAREEILKNNKVRVVISFKGREITHPEFGFAILDSFKKGIEDVARIAKDGKLEGHLIEAIFEPKKK
jgi:translation initiation factor IF-3